MQITVLTPTYNRSGNLKELYDSLCKQTSMEFEWLIVDDGSSDETKTVVDDFIAENQIAIRYIYKENGGKHTALNVGIANIESELTFIVDSDDKLTEKAIEIISYYNEKYSSNEDVAGYSFLRMYPDGKINGKSYTQDDYIDSYINVRINSHDTNSDKAEVFKTKCLKEFPFPEFSNEKFLGEDIVWVRMGRKYKMAYINKAIYIGNYLDDGLTINRRAHNIASPFGCITRADEFIKSDICIRYRIKAGLQKVIYSKIAGITFKEILNVPDGKILLLFCYIPGCIIKKRWISQL